MLYVQEVLSTFIYKSLYKNGQDFLDIQYLILNTKILNWVFEHISFVYTHLFVNFIIVSNYKQSQPRNVHTATENRRIILLYKSDSEAFVWITLLQPGWHCLISRVHLPSQPLLSLIKNAKWNSSLDNDNITCQQPSPPPPPLP